MGYWRCIADADSYIKGAVYVDGGSPYEDPLDVVVNADKRREKFEPWEPRINDWVVVAKEDRGGHQPWFGIVAILKGDRAEVLLKGQEKLVTVNASKLIPILHQAPHIPPKNPAMPTPEPRIKPGDQFVRLHDHEYEEYLIWSIPQRFGTPATDVHKHIDDQCIGTIITVKDAPFEYDMNCATRPSGKITLVSHDHASGYNWPLRSCAKIGDYLTLLPPPEGDPFANDMAPESKAAIGKVVILVAWNGVGTLNCASDAGAIFWPARLCKLTTQSQVRELQETGRVIRAAYNTAGQEEKKGRGPMKCKVHGIRYECGSSCPKCAEIGAHAGSPLATTDPAVTRTPASGDAHGDHPAIPYPIEPMHCDGCDCKVGVKFYKDEYDKGGRGQYCDTCYAKQNKSWIQALYDDRIANKNRDCPPVEERYVEGEFVGLFPKLKPEPAEVDRPSYAPMDKAYGDAAKKKLDEIHMEYRHIGVHIAEKDRLYEELRAIRRGVHPPIKSNACTCGAWRNEAHLPECPYLPF